MYLENYEIAILVKMYDEQVIGKAGYKSIQTVRSKINWTGISSAYKVRKRFETIARRLVARRLLSDDGKSMKVLYLDKLGVGFVMGFLKENQNALADLEDRINAKAG